jgi:hypothetical protein
VPSPEPAPEIDLGDRNGEPGDTPPDRPRSLRTGNTVLALAVAAILLAASIVAVVKMVAEPRTEAELLVSSFLEAALRGDAEKALSMTDHYAGIPLVRDAALDDRWTVVDVAQVAYEDGRRAEVYVEIETHDGVRVGDRFVVDYSKGAPRLSNALKRVEWYTSFNRPLVNGADVEVRADVYEQTYYLLPGSYEFTERVPEAVALEPVEAVVLGSTLVVAGEDASRSFIVTDRITFTDPGHEALAEAVGEYLDDCVAQLNADGQAERCAVAPTDRVRRELTESQGLSENADAFDGAIWDVTAYPNVSVSPGYWGRQGVPVLTLEPGTARVDLANGAALECPLWMEGLSVRFDDDDTVVLEWQPFGSTLAEPGCSSFTSIR